jgi:outer membrane protein assembly factor BamA
MRSAALSLCLFLAAAASYAQEPARYRLERVIVEGSNIDEDTVRAETRLEEEQSYTEEDFRQGLYRVRRLPFVTDAVYRIEPGVTGGGTTLVIRILDTTPIFYGLNAGTTQGGEGESETTGDFLLGGRWLLDNLGVLEGAVQKTKDEDGFLAGFAYRAYNIYGTGGYASLAVAQRFKGEPFYYDPTVVLNLGYPLTQKQTVTFTASRAKSRLPSEFDVEGDDDDADVDDDEAEDDNQTLTQRDRFEFAEVRWWYETIDDPIFTTRGVQFSAGPRWSTIEHVAEVYDVGDEDPDEVVLATTTGATSLGFALDGAGYRPFTPRNSAFLRFGGDYAKTDEESDLQFLNGTARVGVTHDFHTYSENVLRPFKARLEIGAGYRASILRPAEGDEFEDTHAFGEAAFVMRHRWGTIRLSALYDAD